MLLYELFKAGRVQTGTEPGSEKRLISECKDNSADHHSLKLFWWQEALSWNQFENWKPLLLLSLPGELLLVTEPVLGCSGTLFLAAVRCILFPCWPLCVGSCWWISWLWHSLWSSACSPPALCRLQEMHFLCTTYSETLRFSSLLSFYFIIHVSLLTFRLSSVQFTAGMLDVFVLNVKQLSGPQPRIRLLFLTAELLILKMMVWLSLRGVQLKWTWMSAKKTSCRWTCAWE